MNPTTITAQPGTPYIDVVREFDAPPELDDRFQGMWDSEQTRGRP